MKIIIAAGGTGGHVSPAIAIADKLRSRDQKNEILFICRKGGNENAAIIKKKYNVQFLDVRGIERKLTPKNIKSVAMALKAAVGVRTIIKDFSPDAVIGTGGYVCWPVLQAAQSLGIPTFIHESNAVPGLVTRLLSRKCTRVFLGHEESKQYLKKLANTVVTGNPMRAEFEVVDRERARKSLGISEDEIYVLSFGGSGGSEKLNEAILAIMQSYPSTLKIKHTHACGEKYYNKIKDLSPRTGLTVMPYIENISEHMCAADIVISRCGAMTLTELAAVGAASILIPSPNVTDNHQYKNAKILADRGCALMIEEKDLTCDMLLSKIMALAKNRATRKKLSRAIKKLANTSAADRIASQIEKAAQKSRG